MKTLINRVACNPAGGWWIMGVCRACKRSIGFFDSSKRTCAEGDCDISDCGHCRRLLHECKDCGDLFCNRHMRHSHETHEESSDLEETGLDDTFKEGSGEEKPEKLFTEYGNYLLLKASDDIEEDMKQLDMLDRESGYVLVGQTEGHFIMHKGGKK